MKKLLLALVGLSFSGAGAWAQSSVTIYGIIDDGLTWSNNQGGKSAWQLQSSISQGNRWGFKGAEDLGGGTTAIFRLENGFNVNTGAFSQGGREFGRLAYVGLSNNTYGTLTLGRQGEEIGDYIGALSANGLLPGGILFPHPGDLDNNGIDFHLNNAVKYVSPTIAGLTGVATYSFGGVADDFAEDSAKSFALQYVNGNLQLVGAYTSIDHPATAVTEGVWTATNTVDGNYGLAASSYKVLGFARIRNLGRPVCTGRLTPTPGGCHARITLRPQGFMLFVMAYLFVFGFVMVPLVPLDVWTQNHIDPKLVAAFPVIFVLNYIIGTAAFWTMRKRAIAALRLVLDA